MLPILIEVLKIDICHVVGHVQNQYDAYQEQLKKNVVMCAALTDSKLLTDHYVQPTEDGFPDYNLGSACLRLFAIQGTCNQLTDTSSTTSSSYSSKERKND